MYHISAGTVTRINSASYFQMNYFLVSNQQRRHDQHRPFSQQYASIFTQDTYVCQHEPMLLEADEEKRRQGDHRLQNSAAASASHLQQLCIGTTDNTSLR